MSINIEDIQNSEYYNYQNLIDTVGIDNLHNYINIKDQYDNSILEWSFEVENEIENEIYNFEMTNELINRYGHLLKNKIVSKIINMYDNTHYSRKYNYNVINNLLDKVITYTYMNSTEFLEKTFYHLIKTYNIKTKRRYILNEFIRNYGMCLYNSCINIYIPYNCKSYLQDNYGIIFNKLNSTYKYINTTNKFMNKSILLFGRY
jgi:hypothetical protein